MRQCLFAILLLVFVAFSEAKSQGLGPFHFRIILPANQIDHVIDSLRASLKQSKSDTTNINTLLPLGSALQNQGKRDSAFFCFQQALERSQRRNYIRGIFDAQYRLAGLFRINGNYPKALQLSLVNLPIAEQYKDTLRLWFTLADLCGVNDEMNEFGRQLGYARRLQQLTVSSSFIRRQKEVSNFHLGYLINLALAFDGLNQQDSALYYFQRYQQIAASMKNAGNLAIVNGNLGNALLKYGLYNEARTHYTIAIDYARKADRPYWIANSYLGWAKLFYRENHLDSALQYAKLSLIGFQQAKRPADEMKAASFLNEIYTKGKRMDSAHHYLSLAVALKDSLFNEEKIKQLQNIQFAETMRQQQVEQERREAKRLYDTKLKIVGLVAAFVLVVLVAYFLYRNNRQKQRTNLKLQEQKQEVEQAYTQLKATQAQLIQREKMASLGELTAGIAHEIQNPLNFVNNFSVANAELVDELRQEANAGNMDEVISLADSIADNEAKISHHGKRADAIVKSMLQHSRGVAGERQPTDINQLIEEHLRLAYHGYRAKAQSVNADINTDYDLDVGQINVVPQEIGQVLLNLFNNAFYAVGEKKARLNGTFEPTVSVSTERKGEQVVITVSDNGTGIPQKVADKVFQPFFTTKPTGEGTGLGLSLSYDIVTKGHGGNLTVSSQEGEGSEFVVELPAT